METERERVVRQAGDLATLVHMDDPDHRKYRALTADWFQPSSLARLEGRVAELARRAVDRMAALGEECDFAVDIATPMPLEVILSILGLPEADYPKMLQLTRELFQGDDPEFARGSTFEEFMTVMYDFFQYFGALVDERRARPTEDLASVIANAVVDGEPIWPFQQISYYVIIATAGHDTTSFTMTGGLQALLEHPDELDRLRKDPALISTAADEMIRWVSPVRHFLRNVVAPAEISGHRFDVGDRMLLSYWSANRDEDVFDDPFRFDVRRDPNPHVGFGGPGPHFCLGAHLARREITVMFRELFRRIPDMEASGEPSRLLSGFINGIKHLPVTFTPGGATA